MKTKIIGLALCALLFALCPSASAQQPTKVPRIGYLSSFDAATESTRAEPIRLALRELGYIEGQNVAFEYRYAEGRLDRYPELLAELLRLKVGIIVLAGGGDRAILAAKNATKTIPIVLTGGGADPVEAGYVVSLARPGGNVTGITFLNRELSGKRLALLKEAVPKIARIAVLYDPAAPSVALEVKETLPVAARALRLTIQLFEVRASEEFDKVLAVISKWRPDALYVPGRIMAAFEKPTVKFALKNRLPSMYVAREFVDVGGLMYYGANRTDSYRRVAYYIDKILKGAKPAELPVEQPTKFELVINLKTAKEIGVTIPQSVLYRADKVIR